MATEYKLSYTAQEIDEKLGKVDDAVMTVNGQTPDENGNVNVSGGSADGAVLYTEQELTDEQKAQARANVDAVGALDIYAVHSSTNLLNWNTVKADCFIDSNGKEYSGGNYAKYSTTDYIPCKPGDTIRHQFSYKSVRYDNEGVEAYTTIYRVLAYDIDKAALLDSFASSATSYTVPDEAAFVRICFLNTVWNVGDFSDHAIIIQDTATVIPYEPYGETLLSTLNPEIIPQAEGAVLYNASQELTTEQQAQARANIDAVGTDDIFEGIPNSNLLDESTAQTGYLGIDGTIYTGGSYDKYIYYEQYIPVSEGDEISLQYDRGSARKWTKEEGNSEYPITVVAAYDKNKNPLSSLGATDKLRSYIVPATVAYIRVALYISQPTSNPTFYKNFALLKNATAIILYEPYGETYAIKKSLLPESNTDNKVLAYLPSEICVAVGRTIEIYNSQVCPNADKYHFRWNCNVGKALKRKFSITGTESLAGDYTLSLEIYDDSLNVVWSGITTLKITTSILANDVTLCTIGDSLTNNKYWLNELRTLSTDKIVHVGTRGVTDGLKHEGRSGFSANAYLKATEYTFENEGVHPFWDATNSCFSWSYYKANSGINPTAVQLFLGTNDLAAETISAEDFVADVKEMVDAIRTADSTIPVFVVHTICWGNQNGIGVQQSSDGFASQKGRFKYGLDYKIIKAAELLYKTLKDYTNVHFVPLTQCHDSEYNFGASEAPVNPRATQKEYMPTEGVHPQKQGYEQMADIMYSVICAKLGE